MQDGGWLLLKIIKFKFCCFSAMVQAVATKFVKVQHGDRPLS